MIQLGLELWRKFRVQHKLWVILLLVFLPLAGAFALHLILINHLLTVQQQRHQIVLVREQLDILRRLRVDIEDAFRGYLLTRHDAFLKAMEKAETQFNPTLAKTGELVKGMPAIAADIDGVGRRFSELQDSQHALIRQMQAGQTGAVLSTIQSGQALALSDTLRMEFRSLEDRLDSQLQRLDLDEAALARQAFWGLLLAVVGMFTLGLTGTRLLTRSITRPLAVLQASVARLGKGTGASGEGESIAITSADEIGRLARSYEEMARRIKQQIQELEAINAIGHEISRLEPDGLDGVLRRITNSAAELLGVDVCLVMLRNDRMGCWVVEAASGAWSDRLHKSVMLWEEFPVSVRAFETGEPAIGEDLRKDSGPEVIRRNLIGQSMLSVPLFSEGKPFGVLVLLQERRVPADSWNLRLAKGFADEAAIAVANARMYEAARRKGKDLQARVKQLEHLAETLAHDLKSPGERMGELAALLLTEYGGCLDARGTQWLKLIEENSQELRERVNNILDVSRVGAQHGAIEAVDPLVVLNDVLKEKAGELETGRIRVCIESEFPLVACHRAYLRQVFDNLISNAIKFSTNQSNPEIKVTAVRHDDLAHISVADNGCGIPPQHRERVFEPFVRLNHAATKGSGIGLTIVKRIVELYGGRVWIDSNGQRGSIVTFTLPLLGDVSILRSPAEHLSASGNGNPTIASSSQADNHQHTCSRDGNSGRGEP